MLQLRLLSLGLGEGKRAGADLVVEVVLDPIDGSGSRVWLGPEVAGVGRVAAELE